MLRRDIDFEDLIHPKYRDVQMGDDGDPGWVRVRELFTGVHYLVAESEDVVKEGGVWDKEVDIVAEHSAKGRVFDGLKHSVGVS